MSEEARKRIAEGVRKAAAERRMREAEAQQVSSKPLEVEVVKINDLTFDPELFVTMKTGKKIDSLFTVNGGLSKATNYIVIGDPGIGKSTLCLDILSDLHRSGKKCLFISGEMTRIDLYGYVERFPRFGEIPTLFLSEYVDSPKKDVVEKALEVGYDVVVLDSFAEVTSSVQESSGVTKTAATKWLVDLLVSHMVAKNTEKRYTTFLCIQQVTKDGVFVGSNTLKHNTTGMLELRYDKPEKGSDEKGRHLFFSKNRRGPAFVKIPFNIDEGGEVSYLNDTPVEGEPNEDSLPTPRQLDIETDF